MTLPFGKYRGWQLRDLPEDYLCWLASIELRPVLREAVMMERARRAMSEVSVSFCLSSEQRKVASEIVEAGRRALARKHHPDAGGNVVVMRDVNSLADRLLEQIGGGR